MVASCSSSSQLLFIAIVVFGETTYLLLIFIDDPTFLEREFTIQDQTPTEALL